MESLWNFVGTAATTRGSYGLENYAYIMEYVYFSAKKRPVFSEKVFGADPRIMQKDKTQDDVLITPKGSFVKNFFLVLVLEI